MLDTDTKRRISVAYRADRRLSPLVRELPWTHDLTALGRSKRRAEHEFYLRMAVQERWSKRANWSGSFVWPRSCARSSKLLNSLPGNLEWMRAFAAARPHRTIVQGVIAQLPWRQNLALLERLDDPVTRLRYAEEPHETAGCSRSNFFRSNGVLTHVRARHINGARESRSRFRAARSTSPDAARSTVRSRGRRDGPAGTRAPRRPGCTRSAPRAC